VHYTDLHWGGVAAARRLPKLLANLGEIPYKNNLTPIYGAIKASDYADMIEHEPKYKNKVILNGYTAALNVVFNELLNIFPAMAVIKIVCEQQEYYSDLANQLFRAFNTGLSAKHPMFSGIEFIQKDSSVMTQPADYLAFAVAKYLDERGSKKDLWCRPIFGKSAPNKIPGYTFSRVTARLAMHTAKINIKLQLSGILPSGTMLMPRRKR
jgi:hypothetical protein